MYLCICFGFNFIPLVYMLSFHWDTYLITVALYKSWNQPCSFSKLFSLQFPLLSHINFNIILVISIKTACWILDWDYTESTDQFEKDWHLNNNWIFLAIFWSQIISSTLDYETSHPRDTVLVQFGLMIESALDISYWQTTHSDFNPTGHRITCYGILKLWIEVFTPPFNHVFAT